MAAHPGEYDAFAAQAASPEFLGRVLNALLAQPDPLRRSGMTWYAAELALELGVTDIDGRQPASDRAILGEPVQVSPAIIGGP